MKEAVLAGAKRIYEHNDVDTILAQQIVCFLNRFEGLYQNPLQLVVRVKLYELLETLILLDNDIINQGIKDRRFTDFIMVLSP